LRNEKLMDMAYFLSCYLGSLDEKCETYNLSILAHHGLIKLLVKYALQRKYPNVLWE